ncbi:CPBP family intramembrane glutamic endopeptidase [Paenibacillus whitsoniae]|uniref:CPBP family intramembrane metalloprotease n=1 Tax=Paenibacillus whitsoniae TaxID=2496558 RepID=A0A3S0A4Y7_9BACL|nr:type II CAAX endopeptidase family protein [Paenibacillus whitsoniae]RTE09743.1 CPBP family intramembrane metalloprotease [Paenibacillus whitsoniae]
MSDVKRKLLPILVMVGKIALTLVMITVMTVLLLVAAAVITLRRMPGAGMSDVVADSFFAQASLWAQIAGFIGGTLLSWMLFEKRRGWRLGFEPNRALRKTIGGLLFGSALIGLSVLGIWLVGGVAFTRLPGSGDQLPALIGGLCLFIGVAVNEELFARGYLQGLAKREYGAGWGIAISTIVFALLHAKNPGMWSSVMPLLNLLLAGLLFGLCREYSGSLWLPIGLHVSWNFIQGCVFGFDVSGMPLTSVFTAEPLGSSYVSGGAFGAEGSILTTIVLVLSVGMLYNYYQRKHILRLTSARRNHL